MEENYMIIYRKYYCEKKRYMIKYNEFCHILFDVVLEKPKKTYQYVD